MSGDPHDPDERGRFNLRRTLARLEIGFWSVAALALVVAMALGPLGLG